MPITSITSGVGMEILSDVFCLPVQIVNLCLIGNPTVSNEFILVDAGMPDSQEMIIKACEKRFGEGCKMKAIVLTHGHFDHIGALQELLRKWDVPVYAHSLEAPYLTGKTHYPEPNTEASSGLVAKMSTFFPRHSIDITDHLQIIPEDGSIPVLPGWKAVHTPGHTPGHISLFREEDKVLLAGDAFTTVEQESLYEVLTQKQEIHGPPAYFTIDWTAAGDSVRKLADLSPSIAITGHGLPMSGEELTSNLHSLSQRFYETEVPDNRK
ncbi:MBL fold metallo-hydrolase [Bacillus salitolerans]|uniref:MBL fold metallo-hydrolase n=1 Tax=Bacillus salitolerans TaxID=1437434 RepID=A0ABW4LVF5_9BACI